MSRLIDNNQGASYNGLNQSGPFIADRAPEFSFARRIELENVDIGTAQIVHDQPDRGVTGCRLQRWLIRAAREPARCVVTVGAQDDVIDLAVWSHQQPKFGKPGCKPCPIDVVSGRPDAAEKDRLGAPEGG